jgi:signal transduction histidine kinase
LPASSRTTYSDTISKTFAFWFTTRTGESKSIPRPYRPSSARTPYHLEAKRGWGTDETSLQLLLDSFVAIAAERDREATLERAVDLARLSTRSSYGLALATNGSSELALPVVQGLTRAQLEALPRQAPDGGLVRAILDRKEPLRLADLAGDPRRPPIPSDVLPLGTFLGVPVVSDGQAIGAILLARPPGQPPYDEQDELFVQAIARQTAVALEAAALLAGKEQEIADRRRAEMLLRVLQVVAAASNAATTIESALQACLDEVCTQTGWDVGHAWVSHDGERLVSTGVWHIRAEDAARFQLVRDVSAETTYQRGTGMIGLVYASGQPIWLSPITADPRFPRATEVVASGLKTVYIFPVNVGDRVAAVLEFFSVEEQALDQQLFDTMSHVVVQLGRVVERVANARELERYAGELESVNRELRVADQLKSDFVSMASHELRTPLTSIVGFASTLLNYWDETSEADKRTYIGVIDRQSQRLSRLVNDLLAMSRIESGALHTRRTRVDLRMAIAQATADLGTVADDVTVSCREQTDVLADPDHLQQMLVNSLSNAFKYGAPPVTIDVEHDADGDRIVLRVRDHGAGVPETFVPQLFDKFSQASTGSTRKATGTGLGLSIVRGLAEANGGSAWYERPVDGDGSVFCVALDPAGEA